MARISRTILHSTEAARRAMATLALTVLLALAASEAHAGIAFVQSLGTNGRTCSCRNCSASPERMRSIAPSPSNASLQ